MSNSTIKTIAAAVATVLAALTALVIAINSSTSIQPEPPKLGQPVTETNVKEAQKAAVEGTADEPGCELSRGVAGQRKRQGTPGVQKAVDHDSGDCTPQDFENKASITGSTLGCDRSNNNPNTDVSYWRAARRNGFSYCWDKTSEGSTFRDRYLAPMSRAQRAAGILPGGYHFAHVCLTSADAEANLWVDQLRSAGLADADDLRPALDVEYGGCSTGAGTRIWIERALYVAGKRLPGIRFAVYSGNWWIGPKTDCLFRHLSSETLSWISGYPSAVPPCGRLDIDIHQYTSSGDHGLSGDINRLRGATFAELRSGAEQHRPKAEHLCRMHNHYAAWFKKYGARERRRRAQEPPRELNEFGKRRLNSATQHLWRTRRYFIKNHDHGKHNYDCLGNGKIQVREV